MGILHRVLPLWMGTTFRRKVCECIGVRRFSFPSAVGIQQCFKQHLPNQGFYVEAGAVDGFFENNSYGLDRFQGWSGILIEPIERMFRRIAVNRPKAIAVNCALVARDFVGDTIEMVENHAMSRITNEIPSTMRVRVSARTLESILDQFAPKKIDLLSLDVEGFEPQVLDGLNLNRWQPDHILCECLSQSAFKEVEARIVPYYELVSQPTYRDFFFRKRN